MLGEVLKMDGLHCRVRFANSISKSQLFENDRLFVFKVEIGNTVQQQVQGGAVNLQQQLIMTINSVLFMPDEMKMGKVIKVGGDAKLYNDVDLKDMDKCANSQHVIFYKQPRLRLLFLFLASARKGG